MTQDAGHLVLVTVDLLDPRTHSGLVHTAGELGAVLATVHGSGPTLVDVLDTLAARRVVQDHALLVPVPGHEPGTGWSWVRRIAAHWWRTRPYTPFSLSVSAPAQDHTARAIRACLEAVHQPVTGSEAGLTNSAWEQVPEHRHHLLMCRGPRCSAQGAAQTARAVAAEMRHRGWGDEQILLTQTGCLFPCNRAPVVCVHPGSRWLGPIHPVDVPSLLDDLHCTKRAEQ